MGWNPKRFKDSIAHGMSNEMRSRSMGDMALNFEDAEGRKIKISADYGLQVEDSSGTVIHDTPDCIVASDMNYGGHIYWKDGLALLDSNSMTYTDGATGVNADSAVQVADISTHIPSDLTNIKGVVLQMQHYISIAATKTKLRTRGYYRTYYSNTYNSSGADYNMLGSVYVNVQAVDADDYAVSAYDDQQRIAPITWSSTTPYLTYANHLYLTGMTTQNVGYYGQVNIAIQGFLV